MKCIELDCGFCGKLIIREVKVHNRNLRIGKNIPYCSANCYRDMNKSKNVINRNCLCCGKEFISTNNVKYKKCCSLTCAKLYATNINKVDRIKKIKESIINYYSTKPKKIKIKVSKPRCRKAQKENAIVCKMCGVTFTHSMKRLMCGDECRKRSMVNGGRNGGKISVMKNVKRSKNEILLHDLIKEKFPLTLNNEPMFNGWDADVIIPELKIAILWNGNWHHKKITKKHSVLQVQNRDKIKIKEIEKFGYTPYVIDDFGSYDEEFVKEKFKIFMDDYASSSKQIVS